MKYNEQDVNNIIYALRCSDDDGNCDECRYNNVRECMKEKKRDAARMIGELFAAYGAMIDIVKELTKHDD